jgi:hypothetical protein
MPDQNQRNTETDNLCYKTGKCYPAEGKIIDFHAGLLIVREIHVNKHLLKDQVPIEQEQYE